MMWIFLEEQGLIFGAVFSKKILPLGSFHGRIILLNVWARTLNLTRKEVFVMATRRDGVEETRHKDFQAPKGAIVKSGIYGGKAVADHRKHKRFQVPPGVFVGFGPHVNKVGQMIDLSLGGLAFRYIGSKESQNGSHLDIFMADNDFYLGSIPFKTVSDFEIVQTTPSSSMTMRRSGVRFGKLTSKQRSELEYFLQHHTLGEA
jgi:hypothetical protein